MAKNTGLGRGLDSIFLDNTTEEKGGVTVMRVSDIEPNRSQPRREFDENALHDLANSIAAHGLIQPIIVRPSQNGYYQIVAGERRWRASKMAGLSEIPVIVRELDDTKAAQVSIIENVQREDLNVVEEATAYRRLITEFGMTQEELASQIGKNRATIANTIRLLDLPEKSLKMLSDGEITPGHARAALSLKDKTRIDELTKTVYYKSLSVRDTEKLAKRMNRETARTATANPGKGVGAVDYTAVLAEKMTRKLGKKVEISRIGGSGKVKISFGSDEELDELVTMLCGENVFDD
ncbi:MAG: ParB/RepB/Spo0J family partition protein [Clostridia bacterium]|nr:ParB/RepB/Spo0J family partition protein [Clostridia bacterium]